MDKVRFEKINQVGIITLSTPKTLNSLDLEMCQVMAKQLEEWSSDKSLKCIILNSEGEKAFCAGGDVVSLYHSMINKEEAHKNFFKYEYALDLMIHQYKKPIICLAQGIVMGGGIGIMNGCSHRIVTETTMMAMPEITIGLFPDVGGSYFLNKMPGRLGLFLGLTGARFYAADAIYLNMADYYVNDEYLEPLKDQLINFEFTENPNQDVAEVIEHFSNDSKVDKGSSLKELEAEINDLLNGESIHAVDRGLRNYSGNNEYILRAVKTYKQGSPTSAFVIYEQIKRGKGKSIEDVFAIENKMASRFGDSHDFPEGVRALLIEKDKKPSWEFKTLAEIDSVDKYFN